MRPEADFWKQRKKESEVGARCSRSTTSRTCPRRAASDGMSCSEEQHRSPPVSQVAPLRSRATGRPQLWRSEH
eukprot:4129081-Pyramimonas_sp.AAC.1